MLLVTMTSLTLCAQSAGRIEGRVTNNVTGEGMGGVLVRFVGDGYHETVTDSTGSYRLTGLKDGDYRVDFIMGGFYGEVRDQVFHVMGSMTVSVNAQLEPLGTLHGRVVDEEGKPAAGIQIEKDPGFVTREDNSVTNENGEFTLRNLYPESYTLVAKPDADTRMQDGVQVGRVATYYPSVTELADAALIPVRIGENVSGVEIRLKSVPVHRLTGVVLDTSGKPAARATVKLIGRASAARRTLSYERTLPPIITGGDGVMHVARGSSRDTSVTVGPGPALEVAQVQARDDGKFEFAAVSAGDWRLNAEVNAYGHATSSGFASVHVSEVDIRDVRIRLIAPIQVEVTADPADAQSPDITCVVDYVDNAAEGAPPPPLCEVKPGPIGLDLTPVDGQPPMDFRDPETGGAERVPHTWAFPGRYRVLGSRNIQADAYVAAVMWQGRDVKGQVVDLMPGAGPFQVIFKSGLGKVRGRVENGEGASVFLVSKESGPILTYRQVTCGLGGAFEIGQVPPGEYYMVASYRPEESELPTVDLLQAIVPIASSVRVEAGATTGVDLLVNKWPW
jgi:5-hydroxyisourate hydrolase-like protein (transthyretin family)